MPLLNLSEKEKQLDKQFREFHKNCSLKDCNELRDYYTGVKGLWRKITGKPRYKIKPGPYPSHFSYIISSPKFHSYFNPVIAIFFKYLSSFLYYSLQR